jgi:hypothetical protein
LVSVSSSEIPIGSIDTRDILSGRWNRFLYFLYVKTAADDVWNAMEKFEKTVTENPCTDLRDTFGTPEPIPSALPESIN